MRSGLIGLAMGAIATAAAAQAPAAWTAALSSFAADLERDVATDDVGGITAAVFVAGDVVWARGFGWADRERHIPARRETIYRVGSISKTFTAVLVVQLAAEGWFDLDDRVSAAFAPIAHLDGTAEQVDAITYRRLASHTAGLIREPRLEGAASGPIGGWEDKILLSIPTTGFLAAPGERYAYSNIGFGILGLAASRAAARPFMDLIRERIIDPLGMTHTFFVTPPTLADHVAVGYGQERDGTVDPELPAREHAGRGYKVPNGGVYSTVDDLAAFAGGIMGTSDPAILPAEWRAEMMRVQTPEDPEAGYGLGVMVRPLPERGRAVGHSGSVAGYSAYLVFDPGSQIGVVLLRNYNRGETNLGAAGTALLATLTTVR